MAKSVTVGGKVAGVCINASGDSLGFVVRHV